CARVAGTGGRTAGAWNESMWWTWLAVPAALACYFLYFNLASLKVRFGPDDMMNMANYWRLPAAKLAWSQVAPWRGYYRPMGGLFYVPLFRWFGLSPAPYHAAIAA